MRKQQQRTSLALLAVVFALAGCSALPAGSSAVSIAGGASLVSTGTGSLIGNNASGVVANHGGGLVSNNAGGLVSNNAGGLSGSILGPAAGLIANNAAGIIANNASGLVSNNAGGLIGNNASGVVANHGGGLVSNNAGGYDLLASTPLTSPVAGVKVRCVDAKGGTLSDEEVSTDAQGHYTFKHLKPSGPLVFVRCSYQAEGRGVTVSAAVEAPRDGDIKAQDATPATTLVAKKVGEMVRAGALDAPPAATIDEMTRTIGPVMTEKAVVEAVILQDNQVAKAFDSMVKESPELAKALQDVAGNAVLVNTPTLPPLEGEQPSLIVSTRKVTVTSFAGSGSAGDANGRRADAQLRGPAGVAIAADGTTYVAEANGNRIRKIDLSGQVTVLAGDGLAGFADSPAADQANAPARFNTPNAVAVDNAGTVYVADSGNHRIRKIDASGRVTTLAGDGTPGFTDGATGARFNSPTGLALTGSALYVADAGNHRIRKIELVGGAVSTVAGGPAGFADGTGAAALFRGPEAVAVDSAGNLYVADRGNFRIRKIVGSAVTTLAGTDAAGSVDGPGATAQFTAPAGVAVDAAGNVYVADAGAQRIRIITADGGVATLAGSSPGFADGAGASAAFNSPLRLAADAAGNLFVPDFFNETIRKIK
ncbi:MAG: repeat containing protein [Cyanobacteria bacterium RYN_339]|nr:repeat containing protein [Cyanobacteria bacterium RYN_339]